jgi:hypothetical protein
MSVLPANRKDARSRAKQSAWLLGLAAIGVYGAVLVWYLTGGAA